MFRTLFLAIALLFSAFDSSVIPAPPPVPVAPPFSQSSIAQLHDASHVIWMTNALDGGRCTATAVGSHTLLTAAHCYVVSYRIKVDDSIRTIESFQSDGNDHLLIRVSGTPFTSRLTLDERTPDADEPVMVLGNPGHSRNVLRFGTFVKAESEDGPDGETRDLLWFQLFAAPGDSGSAMVDRHNHIIGIVTAGLQSDAMTFTYELHFSVAQIATIE